MPNDSQKIKVSALPQLQHVLKALVALQDAPDLLAPSIESLLRHHNLHQDADVYKAAVEAIRAFPWDQVVTFTPMPDRKPDGGFLEIGAYDGDTYAWENSVKLMLGSNGKVYAEVVECVTQLPDLDDDGRPLHPMEADNHYFMTEQPVTCPNCGARTEFTETADPCRGCGAVIQSHTCLDCRYKFFIHAIDEVEESEQEAV